MPCLVGCLALFFPRFAIILVAIFSNYLGQAFDSWVWPVLGFFFLPLTTLAYAWAWRFGDGSMTPLGVGAVVLALLLDLGSYGAGENGRRSRRRGEEAVA